MAVGKKSYGGEYTASYSNMRGVDFSCRSKDRYAYLENLYRDYDSDAEELKSIPGFRRITNLTDKINGIFAQKSEGGETFLVAHAGTALYRIRLGEFNTAKSIVKIGELRDGKSRAFQHGYELFVLDGEKIVKVTREGECVTIGDEGAKPYVPTTYVDGMEYEQRNLLTNEFIEKCTVQLTELYGFGTHGLHYRVTDEEKKLCAVIGISAAAATGEITIPSYMRIGGGKYKVTEIADLAFENQAGITAVRISNGVLRIGGRAFLDCAALRSVYLPGSIELVDREAFADSGAIEKIYIQNGIRGIDSTAFKNVSAAVYFSGTESGLSAAGGGAFDGMTKHYNAKYDDTAKIDVPIYTPAQEISRVSVNGEDYNFEKITRDGRVVSLVLSSESRVGFDGAEICVEGVAIEGGEGDERGGLLSVSGYTGGGLAAVFGCTLCESFDGRIFLSGNPNLPNTVIYSSLDSEGKNNPLYFGTLNYFNDGVGAFSVISMLATGDSLAVFKSDDDGCGSIFYHTPKDTGINVLPRIYPVTYTHGGIGAVGDSISFFDDPVFITRSGLCALEKKTINLERSICCRSHNVNKNLLLEDLKNVVLVKWRGYLAICARGRIYLADSRAMFMHESGHYEYEWYFLSGICGHLESERVYRYSSVSEADDLLVHSTPDEVAEGTVYSKSVGTKTLYYTLGEEGEAYAVYRTEELTGGTAYPLCAALSVDDELLIFGTECGDIMIFNNDMRGVVPNAATGMPTERSEDYTQELNLHYYDFANYATTYALKTAFDDCGIPHLTKNTVKNSLVIKCSVSGKGVITCEVGTDKRGYTEGISFNGAAMDFGAFDFSSVSFETTKYTTLPIAEKEKDWIEKQIAVSSRNFRSPIGIYSLTYRFNIKGKIKRNR